MAKIVNKYNSLYENTENRPIDLADLGALKRVLQAWLSTWAFIEGVFSLWRAATPSAFDDLVGQERPSGAGSHRVPRSP